GSTLSARRWPHVHVVNRRRCGRSRAAEQRADRIAEGDRRDEHDRDGVQSERQGDGALVAPPALEAESWQALHPTAAPIDASTRPARRAASAMRSGFVTNEMRKNPSPPAPKLEPAMTTTPSSSSRRS